VEIVPAQSELAGQWLDGAAGPLARVLDQLAPSGQAAFLKAMDLPGTGLRTKGQPGLNGYAGPGTAGSACTWFGHHESSGPCRCRQSIVRSIVRRAHDPWRPHDPATAIAAGT